ncbi:hypothetical protein LCGC14_0963760 [marine sediment metagenome]|uniref:HNH nuclease domain-containing protein n=1 Tax=marine sediment metagenome TaxID=412755 RepID=A0A0F9RKA6_9ZZZZ|nr:hypothetical protein [Candidatus Aminicenantes bacterium]
MARKYTNHPEIKKQEAAWRGFLKQKKRKEINGVMGDYNGFLKTPKWKEYRKWLIDIYNKQCWFCGSKKTLLVHHIRYNRRSLLLKGGVPRSVVVICSKCHDEIHQIQKARGWKIAKCTRVYASKLGKPIHMTNLELQVKMWISG